MAAHLLADLPPVPDIPRWLETRAMLRSPHVTVTGGQDGGKVGWVVRLVHGAISALAVVGCPRIGLLTIAAILAAGGALALSIHDGK